MSREHHNPLGVSWICFNHIKKTVVSLIYTVDRFKQPSFRPLFISSTSVKSDIQDVLVSDSEFTKKKEDQFKLEQTL